MDLKSVRQSRREFVRTLFVATQAAALGGALPRLMAAAEKPAGLNFLAVGDWGRNGEKDQREVARQMGIAAAAVEARFILSVGDNFYENGVSSASDAQWQTSFEKVYTAPALQVPWQVILGNHDYHGNCEAQIAYSKTSPRWRMPARYYTQAHKIDGETTVDFFYLDTSPMVKKYHSSADTCAQVRTQDVARQLDWFKRALAASKAPWKIVIGHHPIYSSGKHGDTAELIKDVLPLLEEHKVQAYFNGHDHNLQHLQAGGIDLFCTGAGSKTRGSSNTPRTIFAKGNCPGFVAVQMQAGCMVVRMMDAKGTVLHTGKVSLG